MPQPRNLNFEEIIPKFDAILERGLCTGLGDRDGQMCIEAAICAALDLPHGDEPACVDPIIRVYKIALNDKNWSSPQARAKGLRNLGIAQIGSKDVIDGKLFIKKLTIKNIQILIPTLFKDIFKYDEKCLNAAKLCESEPTVANCHAAAHAANATTYASFVSADSDKYLILSANLALDVLKELNAPGIVWI